MNSKRFSLQSDFPSQMFINELLSFSESMNFAHYDAGPKSLEFPQKLELLTKLGSLFTLSGIIPKECSSDIVPPGHIK